MKELKKIVQDGILLGLGLAVLTKEKVEETAMNIQKEYKLSPQEGKKFVQELLKKSEQASKKLETQIENKIKEFINKVPLATKKDLDQLEKKLSLKFKVKK